jgi:glutaminyl-tRNA synthetase
MAVLDPVKVVITNYPEGEMEELITENNPEDPEAGSRKMPFSRELYIERKDFMEDPPKKFFRLGPGRNVRLKSAYIIHCDDFVKDEAGNVTEIHCTYYPDSKSGEDTSGVKAKGTLHWVSAAHAKEAAVQIYDRLFTDPKPTDHEDKDFKEFFNQDSLQVIEKAYIEPALAEVKPGETFQFLRLGYFASDDTHTPEKPVFNRTVTLRDTWAKVQKNKG